MHRRATGRETRAGVANTMTTRSTRTHDIELAVDGDERTVAVEPRTLLVHLLRDGLGYTGPKVGCESSRCGACTVLLDGRAVKSCTVLGVQADGATIRTAASLGPADPGRADPTGGEASAEGDDGDDNDSVDGDGDGNGNGNGNGNGGGGRVELDPLRAAFRAEHATQCGYCTPGLLATTADLLAETPDPDREEIRHALEGNLCRCTGYQNVVDAVETAAEAYPIADGGSATTGGPAADENRATGDEWGDGGRVR
jgi:carbon-monoxide dehydrogenase small subunit